MLVNDGPADIAIVTSYGFSARDTYAKISDQLKWEYAQAHGYHFFADCSELTTVGGTRSPYFGQIVPLMGFIKLDLLLHFLPRYKAVVWMDADLLITNKEKRLETPLEEMEHCGSDVGVCQDHNGFHSTVIIARNTPIARDYLWAANNTGRSFYAGDPWHEMTALRHFAQDDRYARRIHYFSAKRFCSIRKAEYAPALPLDIGAEYDWEPGDFALHASALGEGRRHRLFEHYADPRNHNTEPPKGPDEQHP